MSPSRFGGEVIAAGHAAFRDLTEADLEFIVRYWFDSGDDYLTFMGIDKARLGSEDDTRARFRRAIRTGDPDQPSMAFAITLDGRFVGYTLLNRYSRERNFSHWHLTDPVTRKTGISTALYPHRIALYCDVCDMDRLTHQTRPRNIGVNRMLDKFVPIAETLWVENPDGIAAPGEFNHRYMTRADAPKLFEKLQILNNRGVPG
jgi:RimJ/RimL family protein N-acetyltransferase